ncbi:MAG TPA: LacI family DNA-binding transcriptional regulator [Candidatus Acidoferrum sp.]|jgi:LacI family transcriptional regulator
MSRRKKERATSHKAVKLEEVAKYLKLAKGTVSVVLNESPAAKAIPQKTKDRIFAAANELGYRPNFFARTLVKKRTHTIGVITEEIGDAYGGMVISGIERFLSHNKYFFITVAHRHDPRLLESYADILLTRGIEGIITVDTKLTKSPPVPTVAVAGHAEIKGVTSIILDHRHAAQVALQHLVDLGHREIAFIRGQPFSSDSAERWRSICEVASELGIAIRPALTVQMRAPEPSPVEGYKLIRELLVREKSFTAIFAYNDISAIGAIRAVRETEWRVPDDISIVGFDDIRDAPYLVPSLTTVRQPLHKMGAIAAKTLVARIENGEEFPSQIVVQPDLVIRESTARFKPR